VACSAVWRAVAVAASLTFGVECPAEAPTLKTGSENRAVGESGRPVVLLAQAKPDATAAAPVGAPSVDEILDKYVDALGGRAALEKVRTRIGRGTLEITAINATVRLEIEAKAPNKRLSILDVGGVGTVQEGFDGQTAWSKNPDSAVTTKSGFELARAKRDSDFYRDLRLRTIYARLALEGKTKVNQSDAYLIAATTSEGSVDKLYFDAQSGLMVRQDSQVENPQGGKMTLEIYYEDHRDVDGVKIPFTMRVTKPDPARFTIRFKHNVPISDAVFDKPAGK